MSEINEKQSHDLITSAVDLIEVWFPIEKDKNGYPETRSWEGMLASPVESGFLLESVPFYLKNVSRGDVVAAVEGDFLQFSRVVRRGGHNTYRLLMARVSDGQVEEAMAELQKRRLAVERNETGILLAIDVPPFLAQREIDDYLLDNQTAGRWQIQDGYLSNIKTT